MYIYIYIYIYSCTHTYTQCHAPGFNWSSAAFPRCEEGAFRLGLRAVHLNETKVLALGSLKGFLKGSLKGSIGLRV